VSVAGESEFNACAGFERSRVEPSDPRRTNRRSKWIRESFEPEVAGMKARPEDRARSNRTPSPSPSPGPIRWPFFVLAAGMFALPATGRAQEADHPGKPTYEKWCAGCHGTDGTGQGDGAAYMLPRPRDFTKALYQVRTTASGQLPTDADIRHVIDVGMPGTAMPGWRETLSEQERTNLVAYLKTFSRFFGRGEPPEALSFGSAPRASADAIEEGRELYQRIECWKCHGQEGRGDGQSAPTQTDDDGFPVRPADLTEPWFFNGGGTVEEIYRRLRTGLDGTPMPSFSDLIETEFMTDEQLWNVAQYVRSLAPEASPPRAREVVRAVRLDGALPATPGDSAWDDIERFYIPLVGQIVVKPRWFAASVDGVWVQAVHDGSELALRLSWSDPSRSPDPTWADWRQLVATTMQPREGDDVVTPEPVAGPAAAPADAGAPPAPPAQGGLNDAIAVQFPRTIPTGMDRPYFLMGSAREPVYLWHWTSAGEGATERLARGMTRVDPLPDANTLTGTAAWEHGQWRVVLRRSLAVGDTAAEAAADADRLRFATRQAIPMALFAWDGDNGEAGTRGAISTWYYIYLEEPTPPTVYATPVLAILLTAGLGVFVVGRAQRRNGAGRAVGREELHDA
jgi:mono/diheme cytochrome c family protein